MSDEGATPSPRWAGVGPCLEILALWALAGAQPVFDLFGKNAEFFLASGTGPGEIVAFTVVVAFAVPLVLILIESLVALIRPSAARALHPVVLGLLGAVLGLNVARQLDVEVLVLAAVIAVAFAVLVVWLQRKATARSVLHYLGIAPLAFALLFLFSSDAGSLVFTEDAQVVEVEAGTGGPVAVLVFDELPLASLLNRNGEINAQRFPNFARLAGMSNWYRNATAINPSTPESVPSILTGQYPDADLLPTSADRPINIFTLMGGSYEVDAFEGVTDLCPDAVCTPDEQHLGVNSFVDDVFGSLGDAGVVYGHLTLPETLRDHLPSLGQSWAGFLDTPDDTEEEEDESPSPEDLVADEPVDNRDELSDFLRGRASEALGRGGQGRDLAPLIAGYDAAPETLLVGHDPFLPHRPWHITPTGAAYQSGVGGIVPGMEEWPESPVFVRRVIQRHLLQVGYADTLLGLLLDQFEEAGTLDEATIAVAADHGMAFEVGGRARAPSDTNVHEIYRVPLFVKGPGQVAGAGEVSDQNALLVDVLPTILDLVDIEPPANAHFDGQSLVDPAFDRAPGDKPVFYGNGPQSVPGDFSDLLPVALRNAGYVNDGGWVSLLQVGASGHLVDRPVGSVARGRPLTAEWEIDQEGSLREVPATRVRPIAVEGQLAINGQEFELPTQVLIAIDGVLAGIGDLDRSTGAFAAMIDEQRLTEGHHDIALYLPTPQDTIRLLREP